MLSVWMLHLFLDVLCCGALVWCLPCTFYTDLGRRNRADTLQKQGLEMHQYCEIFGGVGSVAGSNTFDIRRDSCHNAHEEAGLKELARMMVMTVWGGLCVIEPTCSSFLRFVSTHSSGRNPAL